MDFLLVVPFLCQACDLLSDVLNILFIDYLEKGRPTNSEYHITLLVHLKKEIAKKTATKEEEQSTLSQRQVDRNDGKTTWIHFKLLPYPPYSLDLALSDYWLFANLKRMHQGKRFGSKWYQKKWYQKLKRILRPKTNRSTKKKASNC